MNTNQHISCAICNNSIYIYANAPGGEEGGGVKSMYILKSYLMIQSDVTAEAGAGHHEVNRVSTILYRNSPTLSGKVVE